MNEHIERRELLASLYFLIRAQLGPSDGRGEVLNIQSLSLERLTDVRFNMNSPAGSFGNSDKNRKFNKFVWNQSFSFPPGEKPTVEQISGGFKDLIEIKKIEDTLC